MFVIKYSRSTFGRKLFLTLGLYFLFGSLGMFATPRLTYLPLSGIALGLLQWSRGRMWAGILLGALLLNFGLAATVIPFAHVSGYLYYASIMTISACFLAWIHYRLFNRLLTFPAKFVHDEDVGSFLFKVAPLAGLLAAAVKTLVLFTVNPLNGVDFLSFAWTLAINDTLSVVILTPLISILLDRSSTITRGLHLPGNHWFLGVNALAAMIYFYGLLRGGPFTNWRILLIELVCSTLASWIFLSNGEPSGQIDDSVGDFREIANCMPQIVYTATAEGYIDYYNDRWYEYTGSKLALKEEYWGHYVNAEDLQRCIDVWVKAIQSREAFELEFRFLHKKSGIYRWHLTRAQPLKYADGSVRKWFATCTDIHEQKMTIERLIKSQTVLAKTEEKFRFLAETMPNLVWISDKDGQINFLNQRWIEYTGVNLEVTLATGGLVHPDDLQTMFMLWRNSVATGKAFETEYRLKSASGDFRWQLARALPLYDGEGQILSWFGSCTDIHDQKTKANELKRVKDALELAHTATRVATWEATIATGDITRTPFLDKLYGLDGQGEKLLIKDLYRIIHPDDRKRIREALRPGRQSIGAHACIQDNCRIEYRVIWPDGSIHWLSSLTHTVRNERGELTHVQGASFDVTAARHLQDVQQQLSIREETARESSRLKSQFLAAMSHEIRTPINGIIGMTTFLLQTQLDAEQQIYADAVRRSGNALLIVINDILDFSKIEAGRLDYESIPFSLSSILEDIRLITLPLISEKDVRFETVLHSDIPENIIGDPGRLRQILTNLLSNAAKFTAHGFIKLNARVVERWESELVLYFEIIDSGIGIAPESMALLFQPFVQADNSTTRIYGGTGLGLTISKHLVESMHGEIGFSSEPGFGSKFWFTARFGVSAEQHAPSAHFSRHQPRDKTNKRVLVVEDVYLNQFIATKALENLGYTAHAVGNGKEAIEALCESTYDLVLMDCLMPVMDGYEASKRIRLSREVCNSQIPIVAMTACAMTGDRERCLKAGMNDYLSKPVQSENLEAVISKWLSVDGPALDS